MQSNNSQKQVRKGTLNDTTSQQQEALITRTYNLSFFWHMPLAFT